MIKEIKGSILNTHCKLIAHGVNAQGVMGSGVAKVLYNKHPWIKSQYLAFCNDKDHPRNPDEFLGDVHFANHENLIVANCFTQQNYGTDGQIYLDYSALEECISSVLAYAADRNIKEIAMPKIGCGLAGGDWKKVKELIKEVQEDLDYYEGAEDIIINVYFLE
jgi:O-acetyl-ADP-ribose deacetylase (regulator of RNase III)